MFNSPFSTTPNSIFSSPFQNQNSEDRLNQLYQEIEFMKQRQNGNLSQKTVFSEIAEEMKDISLDEKRYIETSDDYILASQQYQTDFSMFLIDNFGSEFSKSKYGKSIEQVLAIIRKKKEDYKNHFAENISEIRNQNTSLAQQNDSLAKTNLELQKQLSEIQKQLGGLRNGNAQ